MKALSTVSMMRSGLLLITLVRHTYLQYKCKNILCASPASCISLMQGPTTEGTLSSYNCLSTDQRLIFYQGK